MVCEPGKAPTAQKWCGREPRQPLVSKRSPEIGPKIVCNKWFQSQTWCGRAPNKTARKNPKVAPNPPTPAPPKNWFRRGPPCKPKNSPGHELKKKGLQRSNQEMVRERPKIAPEPSGRLKCLGEHPKSPRGPQKSIKLVWELFTPVSTPQYSARQTAKLVLDKLKHETEVQTQVNTFGKN